MIAESFSKEQLTRNASTTLSVSKYQHNNFHYFQTTGTSRTLLEILSEHTPDMLTHVKSCICSLYPVSVLCSFLRVTGLMGP